MRKLVEVIILSFCTIAAMDGQTPQGSATDSTQEQKISQPPKTSSSDAKASLAKMRVLLGQMQRNVAFVSAGDTPLKHQLELEIEMWQILIADMEQKLNAQQVGPPK
jgi:hypothetical protein